jgi:hypothetical protein
LAGAVALDEGRETYPTASHEQLKTFFDFPLPLTYCRPLL